MDEPILDVRNLVKHFSTGRGLSFKKDTSVVKAGDGVSFSLWPGETLGLVGESGGGKPCSRPIRRAARERRAAPPPRARGHGAGRDPHPVPRGFH